MKDRRLYERIALTPLSILQSFTVSGRKTPSLAWFLPAVVFVNAVSAALGTYGYYLTSEHVGADPAAVVQAGLVGSIITGVIALGSSLAVGAVSDRLKRRKPFFAAAVPFLVAGALISAYAPNLASLYVGTAIAALGSGCIFGTYLAIAMETMTVETTAARDINVVVACTALAGAIVPLFAPMLLGPTGQDYVQLLIATSILTALSLVFLAKVKAR